MHFGIERKIIPYVIGMEITATHTHTWNFFHILKRLSYEKIINTLEIFKYDVIIIFSIWFTTPERG